jgi:hypothetical protein
VIRQKLKAHSLCSDFLHACPSTSPAGTNEGTFRGALFIGTEPTCRQKEHSMSITITPTSASIALGATLQLTSSAPAKWDSACPDIATVTREGLVTATEGTYEEVYHVIGGQVQISATELRADGSPTGSPAVCTVTVISSGTQPFTRIQSGFVYV